MNKTFLGHLDVSSGNINDLAYKAYVTAKNLIENFDMLDKQAIIYMLKTLKQGLEIALSDFKFAQDKTPTEDKLYPYLDYLVELMKYAFTAVDELIYIIEKEFDGHDDSFKVLIKDTLSYIQDITYCVHNWIKELRNQIENGGTNTEENEPDDSSSEED